MTTVEQSIFAFYESQQSYIRPFAWEKPPIEKTTHTIENEGYLSENISQSQQSRYFVLYQDILMKYEVKQPNDIIECFEKENRRNIISSKSKIG